MKFSRGYDTIAGERGQCLSGGQIQRIAIARTILQDPKILLLDEATSKLDAHTEQGVQAALTDRFRGRTKIVVTHRLSTIESADSILVLGNGTVVESGTHSELMDKSNGVYRDLWNRQAAKSPAI
jgi:ABC-type multidrug transport system fused ATPase/permease subunit